MKLLDQPELSDIAGIQDSQSYSPECTITLQTASSDIAGIKDSQSYSPECTITSPINVNCYCWHTGLTILKSRMYYQFLKNTKLWQWMNFWIHTHY